MPNPPIPEELILEFLEAENWDAVSSALAGKHPADIADLIQHAPTDAHSRLFSLLSDDVKPDVLAEIEDHSAEILRSLSNDELSDIVEEMSPDDAADILADLSDARSEQVLELMEKEESEDVRRLLEYDEETAGGIMTTDVVAMRERQTVEDALDAIANLDEDGRFYYAYLVDEGGRLAGYVEIWDLLRQKDRQCQLDRIAHRQFVAANVHADQEEVAQIMSKYDLSALPVVDDRGVLVGRVTADDVMEVIEEEASEDILRLAGSDDAELDSPSPLRSCAVRLPWLLVTLLGGVVTSTLLRGFLSSIGNVLILGAFVPVVLAMGGNTGIQSSTLVVRSIALGRMKGRGVLALLGRELLVGAIMGLICAAAIGLWAHVLIANSPAHSMGLSALHLAAVVGMALFSAMTFAAMFGAFVPLVLNKFGVDPAVASGPFITMANDISALLIYFGVTILLVLNLTA